MRNKHWHDIRGLLWYEGRVLLGWSALLPVLGLPGYALLRWLVGKASGDSTSLAVILRAFEVILPLASGLSAAHLLTIEYDEGFEELRRSYPEPAFRLPLLRMVAALVLWLAAFAVGYAAFQFAWGPLDTVQILWVAIPPSVFLVGLSLLVAEVSHSFWGAAGVVMGYWFLEVLTQGSITGRLYLFDGSMPLQGWPDPVNRWLLLGAGLLLLVITAVHSARQKGWGARRMILALR